MLEKETIKYQKYLKIRNKKKVKAIDKIKYYDLLKDDYDVMATECSRRQNKIEELKRQLTSTTTSLKVANERLEQLEYDLKQKKTKKKKKEDK